MSRGDIDLDHRPYRKPLERDAAQLGQQLAPDGEVILLGSIATGKYAELMHAAFGSRLKFPEIFVGRGDMSRGGMLLRAVRKKRALVYQSGAGALCLGKRPARLERLRA